MDNREHLFLVGAVLMLRPRLWAQKSALGEHYLYCYDSIDVEANLISFKQVLRMSTTRSKKNKLDKLVFTVVILATFPSFVCRLLILRPSSLEPYPNSKFWLKNCLKLVYHVSSLGRCWLPKLMSLCTWIWKSLIDSVIRVIFRPTNKMEN